MTRIVTYAHRYKRPPKKRKAVALEVPAIVTRARKRLRAEAPDDPKPTPANDDRKPTQPLPAAIVTAKPKRRIPDGPPTPMELPASRREPVPVQRDGENFKRLKAAMTRRLRGE